MAEPEQAKRQTKKITHSKESGGCGADITAYCHFFELQLPIMTPNGPAMMSQVIVSPPMVCPGCEQGLVFEQASQEKKDEEPGGRVLTPPPGTWRRFTK